MLRITSVLCLTILLFGCKESTGPSSEKTAGAATVASSVESKAPEATTGASNVDSLSSAGEFSGKEIPILCYHQLRDWKESDSKSARVYIMPLATFREEMKVLHDSGYTTVLPDEMMAYLQHKGKLPAKPVMLTFDDATAGHYTEALPELEKYGFKAVFYIMTVVLNRPNYLTKDQVKLLSDKGHVIGCHTWDHHMTTKYKEEDWVTQVDKPRTLLEKLTGKPVKYFAYPFGLWNVNAAQHIKDRGFTAAFQLAEKKDENLPMFTLRRVIADGNWTAAKMLRSMRNDFKN
jgi:peptidoglycan/xylan/chitin deacetylase (PgdA/CDA1 family)